MAKTHITVGARIRLRGFPALALACWRIGLVHAALSLINRYRVEMKVDRGQWEKYADVRAKLVAHESGS